jgi:hypothetical protein
VISHSLAYEVPDSVNEAEKNSIENEEPTESPEKIIRDHLFEYYNRGNR